MNFVKSTVIGVLLGCILVVKAGPSQPNLRQDGPLDGPLEDALCNLCIDVMGQIDNVIIVNGIIDAICEGLAQYGLDDECWAWYAENSHIFPSFIGWLLEQLANFLGPEDVCQTLNFCPAPEHIDVIKNLFKLK